MFRGFPTRMVYLYCISCLRYTIQVGNPPIVFFSVKKADQHGKLHLSHALWSGRLPWQRVHQGTCLNMLQRPSTRPKYPCVEGPEEKVCIALCSTFKLKSVCLSVYLSICLSFYFSIDLAVLMPTYLFTNLTVYPLIWVTMYLSMHLCTDVSIYLSVCLSVLLSIDRLIYLSVYLLVCQFGYQSICLPSCLSAISKYLSVSVCISVFVSLCLHIWLLTCLVVYPTRT